MASPFTSASLYLDPKKKRADEESSAAEKPEGSDFSSFDVNATMARPAAAATATRAPQAFTPTPPSAPRYQSSTSLGGSAASTSSVGGQRFADGSRVETRADGSRVEYGPGNRHLGTRPAVGGGAFTPAPSGAAEYGTGVRSDRPGITPGGLAAGWSAEAAADAELNRRAASPVTAVSTADRTAWEQGEKARQLAEIDSIRANGNAMPGVHRTAAGGIVQTGDGGLPAGYLPNGLPAQGYEGSALADMTNEQLVAYFKANPNQANPNFIPGYGAKAVHEQAAAAPASPAVQPATRQGVPASIARPSATEEVVSRVPDLRSPFSMPRREERPQPVTHQAPVNSAGENPAMANTVSAQTRQAGPFTIPNLSAGGGYTSFPEEQRDTVRNADVREAQQRRDDFLAGRPVKSPEALSVRLRQLNNEIAAYERGGVKGAGYKKAVAKRDALLAQSKTQ